MRVALLSHGLTVAVRRARFPADEPLDHRDASRAPRLPRVDEVHRAPSLRCLQTAEALGLESAGVTVDAQLATCDFGSWAGRPLDEVAAGDPDGLGRWLADPQARPHGGETMGEFVARIGAWLDARTDLRFGVLAVVDPAVLQAAIVHALGAPVNGIWRVDVAALTLAVLVGRPGRWNLRQLEPA